MIYNKIKYYEDGIVIPDINLAFTVEYPSGLSPYKYRDVACNGINFAAISSSGGSYSLNNGTNWASFNIAGNKIFYEGGYYIVIQNSKVFYSSDLSTWAENTPSNTGTKFDVMLNDGFGYLLVGHTGNTLNSWYCYSINGSSTVPDFTIEGISDATIGSMVCLPTQYVYRISLRNSNLAYDYNINKQTWKLSGEFPTNQHTEFAYNEANGMYLAMGSSLEVAVRKSWNSAWETKTLVIDTPDYAMSKVLAANGYFFVLIHQYDGKATVAYSKDGNDWKYAPIQGGEMTDEWYRMAVGTDKAIIMSQLSNIAISNLN